jgi:hypothetical protein
MQPNQTTQGQSMNPQDAKLGLGIITNLQKYLLPQQGNGQPMQDAGSTPTQDPNQGAPSNQSNQTDVKAEIAGTESRIMDEINTLRAEMKQQGDGKKELEDLKKQIESVLNSND